MGADRRGVGAAEVSALGCANCGTPTQPEYAMVSTPVMPSVGYVYAVGRLTTRFPTLGVEKEFIQLIDAAPTTALVEVDQLRAVLSEPDNRYLGRHLCWVFVTQHVDAFIVVPRDADEIARLVESLAVA